MPGNESTARLTRLLESAPAHDVESLFERHGVAVEEGTEALVEGICLDGSNTIASLFRGWEGVAYLELVQDVARKLDVGDRLAAGSDEATIEQAILGKVIEQYLKDAPPQRRDEIRTILSEAGVDAREFKRALATSTLAVVIAVLRREIVAQIVRAVVGKAAAKAAASGAARLVGLAVPFLNLVLAAWAVFDIAGPAFRKTVPTIIEVALIRIESSE